MSELTVFLIACCVNAIEFNFPETLSLLSSFANLSTNLLGQPRNRSKRIQYSIFVVWELRDYNKMLEKADIKIIDFDDFVFCTTESKSITFNAGLFLEDGYSQRRKSQIQRIFSHTSSVYSPPTNYYFNNCSILDTKRSNATSFLPLLITTSAFDRVGST